MGCVQSAVEHRLAPVEGSAAADGGAGHLDPAAHKAVTEALRSSELGGVADDELRYAAPLFGVLDVPALKRVVEAGSTSERMLLLAEGEAVLTIRDERGFHAEVKRLKPGDTFAEICLFFPEHGNNTTLSTMTDCKFYILPRDKIPALQMHAPKLAAELQRRTTELDTMISTINLIPVFQSMETKKKHLLVEACHMRKHKKGSVILEQGTVTEKKFYMISSGAVDIIINGQKVRTLPASKYFGEVAVVSDTPHSATVRVTDDKDAIFLELDKLDFLNLLNNEETVLAEFGLRVAGTQASLIDVIQHRTGRNVLANYIVKEHAFENIEFWLQVDSLESVQKSLIRRRVLRSIGVAPEEVVETKEIILKELSKKIFDKFLAPDAPSLVNVSGPLREKISQRITDGDLAFDMFHDAKEEVYNLLEDDSFARFLQSSEFRMLLKKVGAYELNSKTLTRRKQSAHDLKAEPAAPAPATAAAAAS